MTSIRCMRCRRDTPTVGEHRAVASNGRPMIQGKCSACGTNKSMFVSGSAVKRRKGGKKKGNGFFGTVGSVLDHIF